MVAMVAVMASYLSGRDLDLSRDSGTNITDDTIPLTFKKTQFIYQFLFGDKLGSYLRVPDTFYNIKS